MSDLLPDLSVTLTIGATSFDISSWVKRPIRIRRGRSTELDEFPPGTCDLALKNLDSRFTPGNASSPYFSAFASGWKDIFDAEIHVVATWAGVDYDRFVGTVRSWRPAYATNDPTVEVSCSDAQDDLAGLRLPESVYAYEVAQDAPVAWWRLGDDGSVAVDSSGNGHDGVHESTSSGSPIIDGVSIASTSMSVDSVVRLPPSARLNGAPWTVEMWVELTDVTADGLVFMQTDHNNDGHGIRIDVAAGGQIRWSTNELGNNGYKYTNVDGSAAYLPLNHRFYLVLWATRSGITFTVTPEINANEWSIFGSLPYAVSIPISGLGEILLGVGNSEASFVGQIADVALYDSALSTARIAAHYTAGVNPWEGDSTGARLARILDLYGVAHSLDTGEVLLGPAVLGRDYVWDYLQRIALTEGGRLFVSRSGAVTFHDAGHDLRETTSTVVQARFTEDHSGADYLASGFTFRYQASDAYTAASGNRPDGPTIVEPPGGANSGATKSFGELLHRTDAEVRNRLQRFLWLSSTPRLRIDEWQVRPAARTSQWPTLLALEIGHRVQLAREDVGTIDLIAESISEEIGGADWLMTFTGSPVDETAYFVVGTSAVGGTDVIR